MRELFLAYNLYVIHSLIFETLDLWQDPPPSHSPSILYLIAFFAFFAVIWTIVECFFFGLPEVEERREERRDEENRRIVSEFERKMNEIDKRLEFIEISLQSTPFEFFSPTVSALLFDDSVDVKPDWTRLESILEQLEECCHANRGISDSLEVLIFDDLQPHSQVLLQRMQRSTTTMDRLIAKYREIDDVLSNDNTESIPEPLERRRRKSTSN